MPTIKIYRTRTGSSPFERWIARVSDLTTQRRIYARLTRVAEGNLGDLRGVGSGVSEFRLDFGPGYRVYFARTGTGTLILLSGGNKGTQRADIVRAKAYYADYLQQTAEADRQL